MHIGRGAERRLAALALGRGSTFACLSVVSELNVVDISISISIFHLYPYPTPPRAIAPGQATVRSLQVFSPGIQAADVPWA